LEPGDCSDSRIDSSSEIFNDALTNLDQHLECGGTGQGIEPAAVSESRSVSCPDGFFVRSTVRFLPAEFPQPYEVLCIFNVRFAA
jgi:hypothetical protein